MLQENTQTTNIMETKNDEKNRDGDDHDLYQVKVVKETHDDDDGQDQVVEGDHDDYKINGIDHATVGDRGTDAAEADRSGPAVPPISTSGGEVVNDDFDDEDANTEFTTETLNRQWSTGTNSEERRQQRKWLLNFINRYVPPDVDEGDAFVVVKVLVEAEIITAEQVQRDQERIKETQRFMSYFEELTDAEWDSTGRITSLYLGYKDLRDCPWELHPDISRLDKLKHLTVGWCVGLPAELSRLEDLETLKLTMNADEVQYDMPASEPPAIELVSLRELDAKVAPGVVGFNLPSWIANSSFPNLEVLALEDEADSTFTDIVDALKGLKKSKAKGHPGLRQLVVSNFEIGENFDTFLLNTIPVQAPRLETVKFQDGKPFLTSVTDVASRIDSGDFSHAFTSSASHLKTLDLQETELFGHRGGPCLVEDTKEHSALSSIVMAYEKLTVVGFQPTPSSAGSFKRALVASGGENGKKRARVSYQSKDTESSKKVQGKSKIKNNNSSTSSCNISSSSSRTKKTQQDAAAPTATTSSKKKPRRNSTSSHMSDDTVKKATKGAAKSPAGTVKKEEFHTPIHGGGRRADAVVGRRFAKYFNMQCDDENDFEKLFFGTVTKKIASETKPLHYRVQFDDGDSLDMDIPEIQEGLDLYDEMKAKDKKKGGAKKKKY
mmetsp:Transcript_46092/g.112577  ORF Transcript_46092/g.112577 Transcript_46092/m.112577 type:complete len:664 (-) Transcript_46092:284-2275(-)